jgi:parvulin-like peptidyl-prolyl cis-trans isomerase-like protein
MTSRKTLLLMTLGTLALTFTLTRSAPASYAPNDSTAAAADSSTAAPAGDSSAGAPADSSAAAPAAPEVKEEAKEAVKDEVKETSSARKKATATKTRKTKAKAATGGKGTAKMDAATKPGTMPVKPATEPQHVRVQHILIGFTGSVPGKTIIRSKEQAKELAYQILDRARKGEDFDELVRKYTDDSPPGIYGMSGNGIEPASGEYSRGGMVPAFGNVGFAISVGNIGIADFDPQASPFGWHIIKRLK